MALTVAQLASNMDTVSASLEAHDVNPTNINANATLRTAALRLLAAVTPWARKGGIAMVHQWDTREVQIAADSYDGPDFTYAS